MRHFFRQFTKYDYLFFAICGIAYYFLIRQYIPFLDDFLYKFCCDNNYSQPIETFSDILKSQTFHYTQVNGRFLVHCFVQFFCSIGGLQSYYICSSLVFVFLIAIATLLIKKELPNELKDARSVRYSFLLLLLLFVSEIGKFFFASIAFTINYMWSTAVYLFFILLYYIVKDNPLNWKIRECILLALIGLVCGSWQESFSIGIAGAIGIYYVFHIKEVRGALWWLLVGFALGAIIGVFAPGNFVRIASPLEQEGLKYLGLYDITQMLKHYIFFQSLAAITVVSLIIDVRKHQSLFICRNWLYYIAILISLLFAACVTFHGLFQLTIVQVFSVILTIKFFYRYCYPAFLRKWDYCLAIMMVVSLLIIYIPSMHFRKIAMEGYQEAETSVLNSQDGIAYDGNLEWFHYVLMPAHHFYMDYINTMYFHTLYTDPTLLSYGLTGDKTPLYEYVLPDNIENIKALCLDDNNKIADGIFISPDHIYMIVRIDKSEQEKKYAVVESTIAANSISRLKDKLKKRTHKEYKTLLETCEKTRQITYEDYIYFILPIEQTNGRVVEQRWLEAL